MPLYFAVLFLIFAAIPGPVHADTGSVPSYDMRDFCNEFLQLPESVRDSGAPATLEECLKVEKEIFEYLSEITIFPSLLISCAGSRAEINGYGSYSLLHICLEEESYSLPEGENQQTYLPLYDMEAMCAQRIRLSRNPERLPNVQGCVTWEKGIAISISRRRISFHMLVDCERISRMALSPDYTDGSYVALLACFKEVGPSFKAAFPSYGFDKYCESKGASNPGSSCRLQETDMWGKALDLVYTRPVSVEMLKACDARVRKATPVGSYKLFASCLRKEVDKARASSPSGR